MKASPIAITVLSDVSEYPLKRSKDRHRHAIAAATVALKAPFGKAATISSTGAGYSTFAWKSQVITKYLCSAAELGCNATGPLQMSTLSA
jgi:hypothetical protein